MNARSCSLLLSLAGIVPVLAAQTPTAPTAEFSGIQLVARSHGTGRDSLRPFQASEEGVKVAILVTSESGGIAALDLKNGSAIETFADDKGTKLIEPAGSTGGFGSFPKVSSDGKAALVTVEGPKLPAAGASSIQLQGTIGVTLATEKETVQGGPVAPGGKLACGSLSLTVKSLEKSGSEVAVELESAASTAQIAEIRWLDAAGKALEARRVGTARMSIAGSVAYSERWAIKGIPATVEFVRWTDMKVVSVPFRFEVAVGVKSGS